MVFYIENGLCAANEQIIGMQWTDKVQFLLMEYQQGVGIGKFFVEFSCFEEFYEVMDMPDFLSSVGLGPEYERAASDMKMELFILMSM